MQLSSLASSALELQLLPLVLRNLITTTPNSTYMYIMIRHSHSATIFEVYLLVSITDINSNHDSMTKVWQRNTVLYFHLGKMWMTFQFSWDDFLREKTEIEGQHFCEMPSGRGIMERERKKMEFDRYLFGRYSNSI